MANYQYIIAGLPELKLDGDGSGFDYEETRDFIKSQCSKRDCGYIDWLDAGFEEATIGHLFYSAVGKSGCRFLREFFAFDRKVREAKVSFLEGTEWDSDSFAEGVALKAVFATANILEREKMLDRLYWQKADELVLRDLFDIDVVLAFLTKARIVSRWSRLDPVAGAEFFRQLVQEVRGTFKGVEYDTNQK